MSETKTNGTVTILVMRAKYYQMLK